jgi:hypothetical protein
MSSEGFVSEKHPRAPGTIVVWEGAGEPILNL